MRGRKPKPTELKVVDGTFRKDRAKKNEPKATGALDEPPGWFTPEQTESWKYALENAPRGLLKKLDRSTLVAFVVAEDLHRQASEALKAGGMITHTPQGMEIQSPYLQIVNKQALIMMKAAAEMGFTPSSRSRVSVDEPKESDNPWEQLASGT